MAADLELLLSYVDRSLPSDEVERVEARLKTDHAFAELLILVGRDEAILREWSGLAIAEPTPAQPPMRPSRRRLISYVTAAAMLLATGLAIYFGTRQTDRGPNADNRVQVEAPADLGPVVARLEDVQGEAFLVVGEAKSPLRSGQEIHAGEQVKTNNGGTAVVRLLDSTRLELGTDTLITFANQEEAGAKFFLNLGFIHADVPVQAFGKSVIFATPHTTITADGSRFTSTAMGDVTGVEMEAGFVDMTTVAGEKVHVPEGRYVVTGRKQGNVSNKAMPARINQPRESIAVGTGPVRGVKASPVGSLVAINSWESQLYFYDLAAGKMQPWFVEHQRTIFGVAFSSDGKRIATGSEDHFAKITQVGDLMDSITLRRQRSNVHAVAFSPNNAVLATASALNKGADVYLWDANTGMELGSLPGHPDIVDDIAFHPIRKFLVTACRDGSLRIWDSTTFTLLDTISAHTDRVEAIAFSPDGRTLASGGRDGLVKLWNVENWKTRAVLEGHLREISSLAFSPDGKYLASAGGSTTIWLWNAASGEAVRAYVGHKYKVTGVSFSADGRTLLTSGWDRTVKLWDVEPEEPN